MMTINDFLRLGIELESFILQIYDISDAEEVYKGTISGCSQRYKDWQIESWTIIDNGICFSVDCGDVYNK